MQDAGPNFDFAMTQADRLVDKKVILNLPATTVLGAAIPASIADITDCIISVQADVAVNTTSPDNTLLISGRSAMNGTIKLSGPLKQAAGIPGDPADSIYRLFNPHDPVSRLFRIPRTGMTLTLQEGASYPGTALEYVTVGTLVIDSVAVSNGVVTLTVIDSRNLLRGPAYLPPVITLPPYNAGLTSEFAVDYLCRYASPTTWLSWPAQRANCVLAAGMRASIWPEVGSYTDAQFTPVFVPGQFGSALTNGFLAYSMSSGITSAQNPFFEWWSSGQLTMFTHSAVGTSWGFEIDVTATGITVSTLTASGFATGFTKTCDTTAGHYFGVKYSCALGSAAVTGTLFYDNTSTSFSFTALNVRTSAVNDLMSLLMLTDGQIEALQMTTEASPASNSGFTPTLILDPSLNPLTALPDVGGKDRWSVLQDIASAEGAVFNVDEIDIAHFVNRDTLRAKTSSLTLSSRVNLTGLDSLEQMSTVATHIQAPVNQLSISDPTTVWQSNSLLVVEPGVPLVLVVQPENEVLAVATTDSGFLPGGAFGGSPVAGATYWQACRTLDGLGAPVLTGVSVTVEQLSAQQLKVTIVNSTNVALVLLTPTGYTGTAGEPALFIGGQNVLKSGTVVADSQWPVGPEILLSLPQNDWLQDVHTGQVLTDYYLSDLYVALPLIRNTTMISDPRIQLLDRVTLLDLDVSQASLEALVVGVHIQLGENYWTRSLDLRACWPPGGWVLGKPGMSELGSTAYLY